MELWLGIYGALFVLGIIAYWLVSMPLRNLITVSTKKKKQRDQ